MLHWSTVPCFAIPSNQNRQIGMKEMCIVYKKEVTTPKRKQRKYEAPHSTSPPYHKRVDLSSWTTSLKQKDRMNEIDLIYIVLPTAASRPIFI